MHGTLIIFRTLVSHPPLRRSIFIAVNFYSPRRINPSARCQEIQDLHFIFLCRCFHRVISCVAITTRGHANFNATVIHCMRSNCITVEKLSVIIEIPDQEVQFRARTSRLFNGISVNKVTRSRAKNSRPTSETPASSVPSIYHVSGDGKLGILLPKPVIFPSAKARCKSIKISELNTHKL